MDTVLMLSGPRRRLPTFRVALGAGVGARVGARVGVAARLRLRLGEATGTAVYHIGRREVSEPVDNPEKRFERLTCPSSPAGCQDHLGRNLLELRIRRVQKTDAQHVSS